MSEGKIKASLLTLPPELFSNILPNPIKLNCLSADECNPPLAQRWLGLGHGRWPGTTKRRAHLANQARCTLHALTQTCKALRALALPLLWSVVHVVDPGELARVAGTLRASPDIARHVRSFCFMLMAEKTLCARCFQFQRISLEPASTQTMTMALMRSKYEPAYSGVVVPDQCTTRTCPQPEVNEYRNIEGPAEMCYMDRWSAAERGRRAVRAAQVDEDVTYIVEQLTSLTTFGWCSPAAPMPQAVCTALSKLETLTSLHVTMLTLRMSPAVLPLWKTAGNLSRLSLQMACDPPGWEAAVVEMLEVPHQQPGAHQGLEVHAYDRTDPIDALNPYVASRAIVAAARGGNLRRLRFTNYQQSTFAIRSLVPRWVEVESWGIGTRFSAPATGWLGAASALRGLLAHASLWLDTDVRADTRHIRALTREEVLSIQRSFQPGSEFELEILWRTTGPPHPITRYLCWLSEDEDLAQQVTDTWNAIVKRGQADASPCPCKACSPPQPKPAQSEPLPSMENDEELADALEDEVLGGHVLHYQPVFGEEMGDLDEFAGFEVDLSHVI